ncbi:jg5216 [Pararge aegeria aegeria]|uniref:Jg5216 protein n=1 Tax=Pararge aegeria aegeria TaxID=348720 RepID=A0A8S4QWF8_9NEOP|nr:jg5216 [Pararge aegeria aegeria]
MGGAHSLENGDVVVPRWNGDLALVNAARTSNESLGATGNRLPRTVDFGTPYKRPMSSRGLQSVEVMTMM